MDFVKQYAANHGTTCYQIAKNVGVSRSAIIEAGKRPFERMTVKTVFSIANGSNNDPVKTFEELLKLSKKEE